MNTKSSQVYKIVLVEDHDFFYSVMIDLLRKAASEKGYNIKILHYTSFHSALKGIKKEHPDVLSTDMGFPTHDEEGEYKKFMGVDLIYRLTFDSSVRIPTTIVFSANEKNEKREIVEKLAGLDFPEDKIFLKPDFESWVNAVIEALPKA